MVSVVNYGLGSNFYSIGPFRSSFPSPTLSVASAMGRRAKNKQGDPLPLHADPDLNGSSKASKPKSKTGLKDKSSAQDLNAKLGKRKAERDDDGERATKKPKGAPKPQTKALTKKPAAKAAGKPRKSKGKKVDHEADRIMNDDDSVEWEDVEDADMRAATRCVCPSGVDASPNLRVIHCRSLFRDCDVTDEDDEDEDAEEFTGFTGGLEDLESDEDKVEGYVPLFHFLSHCL